MKRIFFCFIAAAVTTACGTTVEHVPPETVDSPLPFSRGVNFSSWFEASSPRAVPFTRFGEQDFKDVKSIGVDVIRLPIHLHNMAGSAPLYTLDPLFLQFLDQAVDWAEQYKIYLILDNHSFDPVASTATDIDSILVPVWKQLAQRYKDRSEYILYEVLNEPHGIQAKQWADIQGKVIAAIRGIDTKHSIVVGGVGYNSIDELFNLPTYADDNIIYTFHFYDPYLFTHQGETWGSPPNLKTLSEMPFPGDAHKLPKIPADLRGTWIESSVNNSYRQTATVQALARQLDKTVRFSRERGNVPLLCGEFGVFIPNSLQEDRVRWYEAVTKLLDERGIARTSWDYFGGFGIFKTDKGGFFESDLNIEVVKAMGFTPPAQKPAEVISGAFTVFDNYPAPIVTVSQWGCDVDMYYQNGTQYAVSWGNADQYGTLSFDFRRKVDWDSLQRSGYALAFKAKADKPAHFDVRFINREDASTIPWRINSPVSVAADGQWHTVRIPLSSMREQGAWLSASSEWRGPEGRFLWDNVVTLAFVAEDHDTHGITVLLDSIKLEQ